MGNSAYDQRSLIFSVTADYALRALLVMARAPDQAWRADTLAEAIGAPHNYLAKTFNELAKSGIVASSRGPTGGFRLAIPTNELSVSRIVNVFDDRGRNAKCLLQDRPCTPSDPCGAHARWSAVSRLAIEALDSTTIADLAGHSDI